MEGYPRTHLSTTLGWVSRAIFSRSSFTSSYKTHPSLTKLVQESSFSTPSCEHPYHHQREKESEQLRTSISRLRTFISNMPKILLKGTSPKQLESWGKSTSCKSYPHRFGHGTFFIIFLETMSQGKLRKEWLEENRSFYMTRLFQPQLPGRGTIWSPSCSRVKATSKVFSPRNMPWPWPLCYKSVGLICLVKGS